MFRLIIGSGGGGVNVLFNTALFLLVARGGVILSPSYFVVPYPVALFLFLVFFGLFLFLQSLLLLLGLIFKFLGELLFSPNLNGGQRLPILFLVKKRAKLAFTLAFF